MIILNGVVIDLVDARLRERKRCQGRDCAIRRADQNAGASIESRVIDLNLVAGRQPQATKPKPAGAAEDRIRRATSTFRATRTVSSNALPRPAMPVSL